MSTSPQQYCLRWNNYQNNLTNVFDQLLQSEAFVDVTLASDGESLKAHKMILSACSPYFQQLFFDNPCSHPIVILKDVKWEELKAVVEFMYRGEINVSQEQLAPLLKVAELLKVRGLADVSRGSSAEFVAAAAAASGAGSTSGQGQKLLNSALGCLSGSGTPHPPGTPSLLHPSLLLHASPHLPESDGEVAVSPQPPRHGHAGQHGSPSLSSASSLHRQFQNPQFGHHSSGYSAYANGHHLSNNNSNSNGGSAGSRSRKRRRISAPLSDDNDNLSLSPSDTLEDDRDRDQLEIDYDTPSPAMMGLLEAGLLGNASGASPAPLLPITTLGDGSGRPGSGLVHASSSASTSAGIRPPSSSSSLNSMAGSVSGTGGSGAGPSSLLNFHNAALAAAAAAAAASNNSSSSSSAINDMDLKPGIREMIREEERAKMLESSHGWLGPSGASALSDSYQYQIQSLWQKCWSTNQSGMVQALRFRERGPLKSWKPETMADAIFAVLREGLSLSQAARKYDIPYPTFVLYANRVHNMLGPSNDGSSDLRPKGRGRPQRILLGSWPEDHIHGVIRAVVFRDATKDDLPFGFGRELCIPPQPGSSQGRGGLASINNGLDMSIHAPFLHGLHGYGGGSGHRRSGGGGASYGGGSSNENSMNLSAFKVHAELGGVGMGSAASASNSPLPLPLLDDANGARDLDLVREEREQAILRAMKKSGDDDDEDLEDGEDDRDLIAEMVSRRRASQELAQSGRRAPGTSAGSRNANADSLDRILMNSRPAQSKSAPAPASVAAAISVSPELIRVKNEKDLFTSAAVDQDQDDLEEYEQDDGLFIAEEETRPEPNDNENGISNSEPAPVLQIERAGESDENDNDNEPGCLVIVEGQSSSENNNDATAAAKDSSGSAPVVLISDESPPKSQALAKADENPRSATAQEIDQNRNCSRPATS